MKKGILLAITLLISQSILFAQNSIKFQETGWTEVLQKAKEENKLIFVDAFTTWCGPCKLMVKDVFPKKEVADFYNQTFVNYTIDMEKGEGPQLARDYKVAQYPTLLFIAADGTLIHRAAGFHNPEQFVELGNAALDPSRQLATLERRFENEDRDPAFLKNYTSVRAASYDGTHVPVAEAYMKTQKNWNTAENRAFVFQYIGGASSKLFDHLAQNRKDYIKQFGETAVRDKIRTIVYDDIAKKSTDEKKVPLSDVKALYKKAYPEKANQLFSEYKMAHYRGLGDRKNFAKAAIKHYKKFPTDDPMELNDIAWTFYTVIEKKKYLKKAVKLAQKSADLDPAFYNHDTIAALYYKLGKKEQARTAANQAINFAKKEGFNPEGYAATTRLLEEIEKL
ncbi:MAG: thioredoxin-related protein [Saprospiraceae bacterium]|jgi:thioredoxin-related protein